MFVCKMCLAVGLEIDAFVACDVQSGQQAFQDTSCVMRGVQQCG